MSGPPTGMLSAGCKHGPATVLDHVYEQQSVSSAGARTTRSKGRKYSRAVAVEVLVPPEDAVPSSEIPKLP